MSIQVLRYDIDVLPKLIYFESEIPTYWPDEVPLLGRSNNADFRFFNQFSFVFRQRDNPFVDWSLPRLGCYRGHNRGHAWKVDRQHRHDRRVLLQQAWEGGVRGPVGRPREHRRWAGQLRAALCQDLEQADCLWLWFRRDSFSGLLCKRGACSLWRRSHGWRTGWDEDDNWLSVTIGEQSNPI